jgi:hypothetical protein
VGIDTTLKAYSSVSIVQGKTKGKALVTNSLVVRGGDYFHHIAKVKGTCISHKVTGPNVGGRGFMN